MMSLRDVRKTRGEGSQRYSLVIPRLELAAGEQFALIGPSGAGKSTVLDLLALVLSPDAAQRFDFATDQGHVDVFGLWREARQNQLAQLRSRRIGYVLQTGGLLGYLTVHSNINLPRQLLGQVDDGAVERLAAQLEVSEQLHKKPQALSVGQRQRVSCARALAHHPQLLLADEPTASLDPLNALRVMQLLLGRVREQGACCVIATHDEELARGAGLRLLRIACSRDDDGGVTATLEDAR
jgi:putative ABC transport system ATP-binding protein